MTVTNRPTTHENSDSPPNGPMPPDWYEANAEAVVPQYEAIDPAALHGWLRDLLPNAPVAVLDVGAGSGRDAAWLASLGHEVMAAEPSAAMRGEAARLHPTRTSAGPTTPCRSWRGRSARACRSTPCC